MTKTSLYLSLTGGLALAALLSAVPAAEGKSLAPAPAAPPSPGSLMLETRLSHPVVSQSASDVFVTVDVRGEHRPGAARSPVNLALTLDRSGSMSGYKLEKAKDAARALIRQLQPSDRLAIVHYGSNVRSFPARAVTAENRSAMLAYVDGIHDDGGTNIEAGLREASRQLASGRGEYKVNRVVLISDGQPTEGAADMPSLVGVVAGIREGGSNVSAIGVGTDFNEDLMQALAERGAGAYGYLEDAAQLSTLFQRDLQQAATLVARNVTLEFTLPEGVQLGEVLGYRSTVEGAQVRVPLADFSADQQEHVVVRLRIPGGVAGQQRSVTGVRLGYEDLVRGKTQLARTELAARVSSDAAEVVARQDKDAAVSVARARGAANLEKAARALKEGKREEAKAALRMNDGILAEARAVAGAGAMETEVSEQKKALADFARPAPAPAEVDALVKSTKARALKGFGKEGSTY